jgi:hypothetical protein
MTRGNTRHPRRTTPHAVEHPTTVDIGWAAGFFEGEGSVGFQASPVAKVGQKDAWPLERLQRLFGGSFAKTSWGGLQWSLHGSQARGFLLTIYSLLSPRRRAQVREVLLMDRLYEHAE